VGGESVRGDYSKLRFYPGKGRKEGKRKRKKEQDVSNKEREEKREKRFHQSGLESI